MPIALIQTANQNLPIMSTGNKKKVRLDVIDEIKRVDDLMRDMNNIIKGSNYRLDARKMNAAGNGFKAGDYKLDIQTITLQKALSTTVAIAYVDPGATSVADLSTAFNNCLDTRDIYRVT